MHSAHGFPCWASEAHYDHESFRESLWGTEEENEGHSPVRRREDLSVTIVFDDGPGKPEMATYENEFL